MFVLLIIAFLLILFTVIITLCINNENDHFVNDDVVILGTARNVDKYLPIIFEKIDMITTCFKKSHVIIYENDSTDNTYEMLQNWFHINTNYEKIVISESNIKGLRTHRLSYARNKLLKEALKLKTKYIVVMDLDDVNIGLTKEGFMSSFKYKNDWAMIGANQQNNYYDIWALRTFDDWVPFDWVECRDIENKPIEYCLHSRYRKLKPSDKLIEVKSCFGGLAIYKTSYLKNCKYYGGSGEKEYCEHVLLHNEIRNKNNGKIYINTKMINH
jgi:hypothetical protein